MVRDYLKKQQLAEEFGLCRSTVYKLVEGIRDQIGLGRYSPYAIADGLINRYVFIDYMTFGKRLNDSTMAPYVPAFKPEEIMRLVREKDEEK